MNNGYKVYSSPPPGSGAITASIIKMFDEFKFLPNQRRDGDVYLKLIEVFKFAFAKRTKIGDPQDSPYEREIKEVVNMLQVKEIR